MSQSHREQLSLTDFKKLHEAETEFKKERRLPHDFTIQMPTSAAVWLLRAGIDDNTRRRFGIGFSKSLNRAVIPIPGEDDGKPIGSIARRIEGDGPKYLSNVPAYAIFACGPEQHQDQFQFDCVITEDVLSAIRCGRFVRSLALLGTGTSDGYLGRILARVGGERVGIWLDPDNAGHRATKELVRALTLAGKEVRVIKSKRDPKLHSDNEIREYLSG